MSRVGPSHVWARIGTDDGGAIEVCGSGHDTYLRWELAPPDNRCDVDSLGCMRDCPEELRKLSDALVAALGPKRKPITRKRNGCAETKRRPASSKPKPARAGKSRGERQ